ncbi:hypothetical protein KI387_021137 [Taxus chinensis]|uniref:NB-ARC domain-containing protein n=1 Tax=Taxus chinensis TaxID=29808 RepID=A0AA38LBX0_TAXCH|nr:hypothetical protein KI387_021137 [Taxus chinensis]
MKIDEVVNGRVSELQAKQLIYGRLESTRSLIVLDDVWRASREDDLISTLGLPIGNCKIVVTTRSRDVCRNMNAHVYDMKHLSKEESWELFCAFAFSDCDQNLPPHHLEQIAFQIEEECKRLSLAVKTVAASLTGKTLSRDWESKLRELKELSNTDDPIMEILKLSYDSLPAPLRPCFAYFSFFPEDERIDPLYLIYLWIAEGFIEGGGDHVEIGWSYINQLANLCLVETQEEVVDFFFVKSITTCKMHDLLLDLAISISKEGQSAFSVDEAFNKVEGSYCRRILLGKKSIHDEVILCLTSSSGAYSASRLRTLSLSSNYLIENIPAKLFTGMRALRVLRSLGPLILSRDEGSEELLKVEHLVNLINLRELRIGVKHVEDLKRIEEGILAPLVNMRLLS